MGSSLTITVARPARAGTLHILHPETMRAICGRAHPPVYERVMRMSRPHKIAGDMLQYEHRVCRLCWRRYEWAAALDRKSA